MTISPLSGATWSSASAVSPAAKPHGHDIVAAPRFAAYDPNHALLTTQDRTAIRQATGLDVRGDGQIMVPVSMTADQYDAAVASIQRIAAARADGALTGSLEPAPLDRMLDQYRAQPVEATPDTPGLDTRA